MPAKRLPWVKLWLTTRTVAKTAMLPDATYKSWTFLLMAAAEQPVRGRFESAAHAAQCSGRSLAHVKELIARGLLDSKPDGLWMHDWSEHQDVYPSDYSREDSANTPPKPPRNLREDSETTPHSSLKKGEGRVEILPPSSEVTPPPPEGASARSRASQIDDPFIETLMTEFAEALGSRERVQLVIDNALGYKKRSNYVDQRAWLRNWVNTEAERAMQRRPYQLRPTGTEGGGMSRDEKIRKGIIHV